MNKEGFAHLAFEVYYNADHGGEGGWEAWPAFDDDIERGKWLAVGELVDRCVRNAEAVGAEATPLPEPPVRYALVEQMGHRATVGTVREVTFCGKPMLELGPLADGSVHLVSPESLYELTWLTEDEARARAKPWTAVALTAAAPHYDSWDDRDDADRRANGESDDDAGDGQ